MVDAIVADERCFLVTAYRSSSEVEALQWGNLTSQYRGRPLFGVPIAQRFPRTSFDEGGLVVRDADWQLINLDALFGRERCVVYTGEVSKRPSSPRVVVETVGRSGSEGVYRLRPVNSAIILSSEPGCRTEVGVCPLFLFRALNYNVHAGRSVGRRAGSGPWRPA